MLYATIIDEQMKKVTVPIVLLAMVCSGSISLTFANSPGRAVKEVAKEQRKNERGQLKHQQRVEKEERKRLEEIENEEVKQQEGMEREEEKHQEEMGREESEDRDSFNNLKIRL